MPGWLPIGCFFIFLKFWYLDFSFTGFFRPRFFVLVHLRFIYSLVFHEWHCPKAFRLIFWYFSKILLLYWNPLSRFIIIPGKFWPGSFQMHADLPCPVWYWKVKTRYLFSKAVHNSLRSFPSVQEPNLLIFAGSRIITNWYPSWKISRFRGLWTLCCRTHRLQWF